MKANTYLGAGMWSWLAHRVTGILLVLYLLIHLWGLHFRQYVQTPLDPVFLYLISRDFLVILLVLIVFHAFNGVRILAVDLGGSIRLQRWIFWVLMVLGFVVIVVVGRAAELF